MGAAPIGILYEHPTWFNPLFAELDRRGAPYERIHVGQVTFDPAWRRREFSIVVNRVSARPSSESAPEVVFFVREYLRYLERLGTRTVNGARAFEVGISKVVQLDLLSQLGLRCPRTKIISEQSQILSAATELQFPVLIKPNIGGSGSGIRRFDSLEELGRALETGPLPLGPDRVGLIQQYVHPKDGSIYRVEVLDGQCLYAIRLPVVEGQFNYCPADGCNIPAYSYWPVNGGAAALGADPSRRIEACSPPDAALRDAARVVVAAEADIGGVEYIVGSDDSHIYFYDINPLSNFVSDPIGVLGFDPVARFVDYILDRALH